MQAMILTAGKGTRLQPYTNILPKPAIPLLNVPLVCFGLELLRSLHPHTLVANLHHLPEKMQQTLNSLNLPGAELKFSQESGLILGGAGGLKHAQELLVADESVFLNNGDEVLIPDDPLILKSMWDSHHDEKNFATLLCIEHELVGSKFGGVWIDSLSNVLGFGKTQPANQSIAQGLHYVGFLLLSPEIYNYIPSHQESNILYDALTQAIGKGERVRAMTHKAQWFETGNLTDYLDATEKLIQLLPSNNYLENLIYRWGGEQKLLRDRQLLAHHRVLVPDDLEVQGFAVVGEKVTLGKSVRLERCVIGPGAKVPDGAQIKNEIVLA